MTSHRALVVGGILNLLLAVFHMLFPWIFAWGEDLQGLSPVNRAIVYTFQSVMVFVLVAFAYLSIVHRIDVVTSRLGRSVLFLIGTVWLIRAVAEVVFFRLGADGAVWRLALFLVLSAIYLLPALLRRHQARMEAME
jgi:hypothetical protein